MNDDALEGGAVAEGESSVVEASPVSDSPVADDGAASSSSPSTEVVDAPETPNFPSYDDFGWDNWAGEVSNLPEMVQPWAQRVYDQRQSWVDSKIAESTSEADRVKEIYNALLDGHDDPRYGELNTKHEALQKKFDELTTSSTTAQEEYTAFKAEIDQAIEQEANRYADWFERTHGHLFQEPAAVEKMDTLLKEGWEIDYVPALVALPDEVIATATKALKDGVPAKYAIQLAQQNVPAKTAPAPRPAAKITSGATSAPAVPHQLKQNKNQVNTIDDMRFNAAQNAFKRHSGGRR